MGRVIVGVDPHKKSVTIEVVDEQERVLASGRFDTTSAGCRLMLRYVCDQWRDRRWAVEGANGVDPAGLRGGPWSRCGCWPTAATSCPTCGSRPSTGCTGC